MTTVLVLFILILFFCPGFAAAQADNSRAEDTLVFRAAVFGPADEIFIWWGHTALIIEDTAGGEPRIFDWGIFSYSGDNFLREFIRDRVRYKCGVYPARADIDMYIGEDRDITLYTLDLDSDAKRAILAAAETNVLPENSYYIYNQFSDNCATRIRDLIDMGTGGQLKSHFSRIPGRGTYRRHILRFVKDRPFAESFLDLITGRSADVEISMWEEMFLPVELGRNLTGFSYTGGDGTVRNLVTDIEIIHVSRTRNAVPSFPRPLWPRNLAAGTGIVLLLLLFEIFGKKQPVSGRFFRGIIQSLLGLFLGAAGTALVFTVFFSGKDYMQWNINILYINPLLLAAVPLGICSGMGGLPGKFPRAEKLLRILWTYVFIAGIVSLLLNVHPAVYQENQAVLAFVLPPAFVLSSVPVFIRKKAGKNRQE
jgi:hypothetical protein